MEFSCELSEIQLNLHHWAIISAIQAPNPSPEATNPARSQKPFEKKKKVKNSKVLNRLRRRKKDHGLFPDFSLKINNRINIEGAWRFKIESPNKTRWEIKETYLLHTHKHQQDWISIDPYEFKRSGSKKNETLTFFKTVKDFRVFCKPTNP